ncbi:MAG: glycosyltransferase family 8 protein [Turicibacter sanguinis]|uniref:glycosyltransferase family 8 protein n=1 Tax=Turicibacter sanguinis TaxID=154288 RepID=UPI003993C411
MDILIAVNKKYLPHAKVMLASLREHMPGEKINVYLLYNSLKNNHIHKFEKYLNNRHQITLHAIKVENTPFDKCKLTYHFSIEIVYRLVAAEVLPKSLTKILWLDSDIIINKSSLDFYNTDINNVYACVCKGRGDTVRHNRRLGLPLEYNYFNSGVMLLNLKMIREKRLIDKYVEIAKRYNDKLILLDQDIMNVAFSDKNIIYFDSKLYNYQIGGDFILSEKEYVDFLNTCCIMHFAAGFSKPWKVAYHNGLEKIYWKYALRDQRYFDYVCFKVTIFLRRIIRIWRGNL